MLANRMCGLIDGVGIAVCPFCPLEANKKLSSVPKIISKWLKELNRKVK